MVMKMVEAIIKPYRVEQVKQALMRLGVHGMTISEVRGFGRQKGHTSQYRGTEYQVDLVSKVKVEIVVSDSAVSAVTDALLRAARTGELGDGKIFVYSLDSVSRIRTGEKGEAAV
jgi:nitrogen regulatory protein PII